MKLLESWAQWIVGVIFRIWPRRRPDEDLLKNVKIVAHRGAHQNGRARENSLRSFEIAVENQIWAIEFDVRFTADHVAVILHDPDATRLFDRPDIVISEILFRDLRAQLPEIPTLQEVIEKTAKKTHLMIEIKEDLRERPECLARLCAALSALTPKKDYHLLTLHPDHLDAPSLTAPATARMGVIVRQRGKVLERNHALQYGAISGHILHFSNRNIRLLHERGVQVGVGFVDSRNSLYREVGRGVDFIFTNHPLDLKRFLSSPDMSP
jgi:glycerophosphoryl diester phosphodiesterase